MRSNSERLLNTPRAVDSMERKRALEKFPFLQPNILSWKPCKVDGSNDPAHYSFTLGFERSQCDPDTYEDQIDRIILLPNAKTVTREMVQITHARHENGDPLRIRSLFSSKIHFYTIENGNYSYSETVLFKKSSTCQMRKTLIDKDVLIRSINDKIDIGPSLNLIDAYNFYKNHTPYPIVARFMMEDTDDKKHGVCAVSRQDSISYSRHNGFGKISDKEKHELTEHMNDILEIDIHSVSTNALAEHTLLLALDFIIQGHPAFINSYSC